MKTKFLFAAFAAILSSMCTLAQGIVQWPYEFLDSIKGIVTENPDVYLKALEKFESLDSTLHGQEIAIVYYGYAYRPEYSAGYDVAEVDEVRKLLNNGDKEEAMKKVIEYRKTNPASLELIRYGIIASEDPNSPLAEDFRSKYSALLDCITSFGDGSAELPYKVVDIHDEYEILQFYLGADEIMSQALTENGCDAMRFRINNTPFTLYFDVSEILEYSNKLFGGN